MTSAQLLSGLMVYICPKHLLQISLVDVDDVSGFVVSQNRLKDILILRKDIIGKWLTSLCVYQKRNDVQYALFPQLGKGAL